MQAPTGRADAVDNRRDYTRRGAISTVQAGPSANRFKESGDLLAVMVELFEAEAV